MNDTRCETRPVDRLRSYTGNICRLPAGSNRCGYNCDRIGTDLGLIIRMIERLQVPKSDRCK